ncbi:uncharacterized protein LOC113519999 [Galleria mellonella]|uniref:Uncharacterized protein LOC113519999 n=1 Tax=Galleria mellonella TaxID=7137 RepID=A0ABM3MJ73_GALME|nr:uncharacterized protein LOC113519999 [Galleria mellonella]
MSADIVIINDDPGSVEVVETTSVSDVRDKVVETIIIDEDKVTDDVIYVSENKQNVRGFVDDDIEIIDVETEKCDTNEILTTFDSIFYENKKLAEFIEKCLDLEDTHGMLRVINKILLRRYKETDEKYKKSPEFNRLLDRKIDLLETDPDHKFSHVKDLCEIMKCHKTRKKVELITLSNDLEDNLDSSKKKKRIKHKNSQNKSKKRKLDNIDKSNYIEIEVPAMNLNINQIDVDLMDEEVDDGRVIDNGDIIRKNNNFNNNISEIQSSYVNGTSVYSKEVTLNTNVKNNDVVPNDAQNLTYATRDISKETCDLALYGTHIDNNSLLVAHKDVQCDVEPIDQNMKRIKEIEERIKVLKNDIEKLEQLEVEDNTIFSPYIQCDQLKAMIVKLYSELCSLTGDEAVKRREIRLQVVTDRPQLAVKNLEKLINDNIGCDGNPHFPDFHDVVHCVYEANKKENWGWGEKQILNEARILFTRCGLAIQQNRQKREWRDMTSRVKCKLEDDPADEDPQLLARLEENRRQALKKESDILDRFVKLEKCSGILLPTFTREAADDSDSDNSDVVCTNDVEERSELLDSIHQHNTIVEENFENESTHIENNKENVSYPNNTPVDTSLSISEINNSIKSNESLNPKTFVENNLSQINTRSENTESIKNKNEIEHNACDILAGVDNKLYNFTETFNEIDVNNRNSSEFIANMDVKSLENPQKTSTEISYTTTSEITSTDKHKNDYESAYHENCDSLSRSVKKEVASDATEDIMKALESLGNSFTTTIVDIEDPFLIIEISSDSSDDDDLSEHW